MNLNFIVISQNLISIKSDGVQRGDMNLSSVLIILQNFYFFDAWISRELFTNFELIDCNCTLSNLKIIFVTDPKLQDI